MSVLLKLLIYTYNVKYFLNTNYKNCVCFKIKIYINMVLSLK